MYYEESIIDGVLHIRSTPDGEWRKLSAEAITLKYMEVKRVAAQQSVHPTLLESAPLEALSTPENSATSQTDQTPQQRR